jgi:protein-S-isoprenylcysteine O-methyltransferase Ste14
MQQSASLAVRLLDQGRKGFRVAVRLGQRWRPILHVCAALTALALSRPTDLSNAVALPIVLFGAALRIWATSFINKDKELCTEGPYAVIRHPLYLGNFVIMAGICVAANNAVVITTVLPAMILLYALVIRAEERQLRHIFGPAYSEYASRVPALLPLQSIRRLRAGWGAAKVDWLKVAFHVVLLVLLVALFELKEEILERVFCIEYQPLWLAATSHVLQA